MEDEINDINVQIADNQRLFATQSIMAQNDEPIVVPHTGKGGRPRNTVNLHSKFPSGIAFRLRKYGVDWVRDLATALKAGDQTRIDTWLKLLPYLVVTNGMGRVKKRKGRASKAALEALNELEGRE